MRGRRPRHRFGAVAAAGVLLVTLAALAGCGGTEAGPPALTWYINPDDGGQAEIAARCTAAAQGRYRIVVSQLPREASEQRQQLVRRLAANDSSIDIMSLDPPYVPEFAQAGFLAPVPPEVASRASQGVIRSAVEGASWRGTLVAVPFWANTQLLWYRRSVAAAAGLDMNQPVTWEQLTQVARQRHTQLAVQGRRAESLTVWVNALVESAGGSIVTDPSVGNPEAIKLGLTEPPATRAAEVIRNLVSAGVGGPALSTAGEDENVASFEDGAAGFMVNWPFVWTRAKSGVAGGTLDPSVPQDYGVALYPQVLAGTPSAPPLGGIDLGVGAFSRYPELAYQAIECATSAASEAYYFVTNGNPAARAAVFDDPAVVAAFPMAATIRDSLRQAAPRPQTAYYSEVSASLQRIYHPPASVDPATVGQRAAELIRAVLAKKELL